MEARDQQLRSFISDGDGDGDSSLYQNHCHPNPFIQNHPFHNRTLPLNLHHHRHHHQSSGSSRLNPVEASSEPDELESAIGRLSLSNSYGNSSAPIGLYPDAGPNDFGSGFFMDITAGYEKLQRMRVDAAARAQLNHLAMLDNKILQEWLSNRSRSDFTTTFAYQREHRLHGTRNLNYRKSNGIRIGRDDHYGLNGERFFRSSQHHNLDSLGDVKGHVVALAKDQCGCRFLKKKLDEGKPEDIEMILREVKDHLHELMMDPLGNYLIQKLFEASSVRHVTSVLGLVIRNEQKLKDVCIDNHGTRAIQKMLEHLRTPEQISAAIFAVKRIAVRLTKNTNGGYVIQQCLKLFSPALTKVILDEVADKCFDIATDKSGCSVVQKCLLHAKEEAMMRLVEQIVLYALLLAEHPYGNYVVQYLIKMKIPQINAAIVLKLLGKYVPLSMNKHASNVVEDLLEFSEESDVATIVHEIMYSHNFLAVLHDPYGNYVAQKALKISKGSLHKMLLNNILSNYAHLHSHLYGKKVLAFAKNCKIRA